MHYSQATLALLIASLSSVLSSTASDGDKKLVRNYLRGDPAAKKDLFASRDTFRTKRGELFQKISEQRKNGEKLLRRVFRDIGGGVEHKNIDKARIKSFLSTLKEEEMEWVAKTIGGCYAIGQYVEFLDKKILATCQSQSCRQDMLKGAQSVDPDYGFVANLPPEWANKAVLLRIENGLSKASIPFLKAVASSLDLAKFINPEVLNKMSKDQLAQFGADFIARIPRLLEHDVSKAIQNLPDDAFSKYNHKVITKNAKAMRRAQIAKFNGHKDMNSEKRCTRLPINELNDDQFLGVDTACLLSFLHGPGNGHKQGQAPALGRRWSLVKESWLDGRQDDALLKSLRNIDDNDKKHISSGTWTQMLKNLSVCENIVGQGHYGSDQMINASGECFAKLRDVNLMVKILVYNPDVNEDILSFATKKTMEKLSSSISGRELTGFQLIPHMKASTQRKEAILAQLGKKAQGNYHACEAIDDVATIHRIKEFDQVPQDCFDALTIDFSQEDYIKSPCLMNAMTTAEVMAAFKGRWSGISEKALSTLLKRNFLSEIDQTIFMEINPAALVAFKPEHITTISYLKELPVDRLNRLADDAFSLMESTQFESSIGWDKVTDRQLPFVSAKVDTPSKRATAKLGPQTVKDLGMRFAQLSAVQLEAVTSEAWTGVSDKVFAAIKPEALVNVTMNQIAKMNEGVLISLTAKQAELIGTQVKDEKISPLPIFQALMAKLDKDTKVVIEKRLAKKAEAMKPNGSASIAMTSISIGIVVAVALSFC